MWLCLTKLSDANLLQILQADVWDKINVFIPVLHKNLVVLTKTKVRQPVCQICLKHTGTHKHVHRLPNTKLSEGCAENQHLRLFARCVEHMRALQACGLAASLQRAACWSLMLISFDVPASWPRLQSGPSTQSTRSHIRNWVHRHLVGFFFSFKFDMHIWHLYMSCKQSTLRNTIALLWVSLALEGFTSYHSFHFITHRHTRAIKHTKGQTQCSVYSTSWNTAMCEHIYKGDRGWGLTGWGSGLTPGFRWQRQEGHDDIIQVRKELIWELCWAEPWHTRGGAGRGDLGSWPYLWGHAANGV